MYNEVPTLHAIDGSAAFETAVVKEDLAMIELLPDDSLPIAPVVDISGWADGDAATRARIAADLDAAARETGFLQLVGHGIPDGVRVAALDAMTRFFRRPDEAKARCVPADPGLYRGWLGRKTESFAYSLGEASPADLVEAFVMGADDVGGTTPAYAANVWPDDVDGFRDAFWSWYVAARRVAHTLAEIAALSIGMEPEVIATALEAPVVTMRANWYERRADEPALTEDQLALGAHTDYGIITVLLADEVPGLEVLAPDGNWVGLVPAPGTLVVNISDALSVWTNDVWRSSIHRVVPSMEPGGAARRSIAMFLDGNEAAPLAPLDAFVTEDRPARYHPTTLGKHVLDKINAGRYGVLPVAAEQTLQGRLSSST